MRVTLKQAQRMLFWFGLRYIPLIGFCSPKIREMSDTHLAVSMPHTWRTKNHLGSIYFGALAIGADLAGAFLVFSKARERGINANFAFKDVKGEFLKRPEAEVWFRSNDGALIDAMMDESIATGQRINKTVSITVTCPSLHGDEPMARFELTLSVKATAKKPVKPAVAQQFPAKVVDCSPQQFCVHCGFCWLSPFSENFRMQHLPGNLFILSAPSGAGKSSLINALLAQHADMQLSVSHTTRAPRPGETDGVHYHFVSVEQFKQLIAEGVFLEWAEVFGNYYGTSRRAIETELAKGRDVFLDIDWQGAQQIRPQLPGVLSIFILPPSVAELEKRLNGRGTDSAETIAKRMQQAHSEISHVTEYDYVLINDDFQQCLQQFAAVVLSQRLTLAKQQQKQAALFASLLATPAK